MSAVETYKAMIDAAGAQRARIHGERSLSERFDEAGNAQRFRTDPRRALNAGLEILAGFIEPGDVLLDVGGLMSTWGEGVRGAACVRSAVRLERAAGSGLAYWDSLAGAARLGVAGWVA